MKLKSRSVKAAVAPTCQDMCHCGYKKKMGSLHLPIDALAQAFSKRFGVLADKIKVKTIELFELCSECLKLDSLV